MGLEIVGDVGDQGSGGDNGDQAEEEIELTTFSVYTCAGEVVQFLQMPGGFDVADEEMPLYIEWNLTKTRNQVGMMYLSQHQVAIPDVVLIDKRMGFLVQWLIPNPLERLGFELAWEQEMGEFIDGLKANLLRMMLTQGTAGAEQLLSQGPLNRQQRREMEREQLRRMHRGN